MVVRAKVTAVIICMIWVADLIVLILIDALKPVNLLIIIFAFMGYYLMVAWHSDWQSNFIDRLFRTWRPR